jgi:zinc D-Ala-D-Ala carboxypeptidase
MQLKLLFWLVAASFSFLSIGATAMRLSDHFHMSEFVRSTTAQKLGISNVPPPEATLKLQALSLRCLEPLRLALQRPIRITSGYRCHQLNDAVGGSSTSQHTRGMAADISVDGMTAEQLRDFAIAVLPEFDQIYAHASRNFVHISYNTGANRNQILPTKE